MGVDQSTREVLVGAPKHLEVHSIVGVDPIWAGPPIDSTPTEVFAQVRAHAEPVQALAYMIDDHLYVELLESIRGLATGQAAAIYQGTRVVGSATVAATDRVNPHGYELNILNVDLDRDVATDV